MRLSRYSAALAVVASFGLLARWSSFQGLLFNESARIAKRAWDLYLLVSASSAYPEKLLWFRDIYRLLRDTPTETLPLLPITGMFYGIFGVSDLASFLVPLLASLVGGALIYLLTKTWFDQSAALIASFLWAVLPVSIFLSTNLLAMPLLLTGDLLIIYLLGIAGVRKSRTVLFGALLLLALGLFLNWTIFLPTAILVVAGFYNELRKPIEWKYPLRIFWGLFVVGFLFTALRQGDAVVTSYYQLLLPFDNLWILPFLALGIAFAANKRHPAAQQILTWLAVKVAFVLLIGPWIADTNSVKLFGMSGYWLMLVIPCLVLLGWQFSEQVSPKFVFFTLIVVAFLGSLLHGILLTANTSTLDEFLVYSRIAFGISIVTVFLYIVIGPRGSKTAGIGFALILIAFTLASPSVVSSYVINHDGALRNSEGAAAYLKGLPEETVVVFVSESLYDRFAYIQNFGAEQPASSPILLLYPLRRDMLAQAKSDQYVVVEREFVTAILGATPANWHLLQEFTDDRGVDILLFEASD